jgi:hypothetical protein
MLPFAYIAGRTQNMNAVSFVAVIRSNWMRSGFFI